MNDTTAGETLSRTRFPAQALVPEWLLAAEPMHPHARRGQMRFTMTTDVIDAGEYYVVVPRPVGGSPIGVFTFDGTGCQVNAISKPVETVIYKSVIEGTDYREGKSNPAVVTQIPAPPEPPQSFGNSVAPQAADRRLAEPRKNVLGVLIENLPFKGLFKQVGALVIVYGAIGVGVWGALHLLGKA